MSDAEKFNELYVDENYECDLYFKGTAKCGQCKEDSGETQELLDGSFLCKTCFKEIEATLDRQIEEDVFDYHLDQEIEARNESEESLEREKEKQIKRDESGNYRL